MNTLEKWLHHEGGVELHCTKCGKTLYSNVGYSNENTDPLLMFDTYMEHKKTCLGVEEEPTVSVVDEEDDLPF